MWPSTGLTTRRKRETSGSKCARKHSTEIQEKHELLKLELERQKAIQEQQLEDKFTKEDLADCDNFELQLARMQIELKTSDMDRFRRV